MPPSVSREHRLLRMVELAQPIVEFRRTWLRAYVAAIDQAFGRDVDYAQLVKWYEAEAIGPGRYSPPKVTSTEKTPICEELVAELVSTSYVERQNLTMRMAMRRFTRLTNGFSKKIENHVAATALHFARYNFARYNFARYNFAHYNFARMHETLRATPAMAAGVESTLWNIDGLVGEALARAW